jgi:GNAT superfamily N-acetyltransferase
MRIDIREEGSAALSEYGTIPISFEVVEVIDLEPTTGTFGVQQSRRVATPRKKDYDASPGHSPAEWPSLFELGGWRFLAAYADGKRLGGATVIMRSEGVDMLEGRADLGLLWDIRVAPTVRRAGVGSALLAAVEELCRNAGLQELKVETQNINVPACRFYDRHGFELRHVVRDAYPDLPGEVQLLWYKTLVRPA